MGVFKNNLSPEQSQALLAAGSGILGGISPTTPGGFDYRAINQGALQGLDLLNQLNQEKDRQKLQREQLEANAKRRTVIEANEKERLRNERERLDNSQRTLERVEAETLLKVEKEEKDQLAVQAQNAKLLESAKEAEGRIPGTYAAVEAALGYGDTTGARNIMERAAPQRTVPEKDTAAEKSLALQLTQLGGLLQSPMGQALQQNDPESFQRAITFFQTGNPSKGLELFPSTTDDVKTRSDETASMGAKNYVTKQLESDERQLTSELIIPVTSEFNSEQRAMRYPSTLEGIYKLVDEGKIERTLVTDLEEKLQAAEYQYSAYADMAFPANNNPVRNAHFNVADTLGLDPEEWYPHFQRLEKWVDSEPEATPEEIKSSVQDQIIQLTASGKFKLSDLDYHAGDPMAALLSAVDGIMDLLDIANY